MGLGWRPKMVQNENSACAGAVRAARHPVVPARTVPAPRLGRPGRPEAPKTPKGEIRFWPFWPIWPVLADFRGFSKIAQNRPPRPEKPRGKPKKAAETANRAWPTTLGVLRVLQMGNPAAPGGRRSPKVPGPQKEKLGA